MISGHPDDLWPPIGVVACWAIRPGSNNQEEHDGRPRGDGLRILVSAYACAPNWGSEPGVGWGVTSSLLDGHEVWLLTGPHSRRLFEDPTKGGQRPNLTVRIVELPTAVAWLRRPTGRTRYVLWQRAALREARRLHAEVGFDVALHVTYGNSWLPTWMGHLGIPFVWYTGSWATTPRPFIRAMAPRAALSEVVRSIALRVGQRLARRASTTDLTTVIAVDEPTIPMTGTPVAHAVLGGMHPWERRRLSDMAPRDAAPFRILSIGRLLGWKGFDLALEAFAVFREHVPDAEYWIAGTGPLADQIARRAAELGLGSSFRLLGRVPRREVFEAIRQSDVLLHPSLHEQMGYVVLEAMAAARPVVCVDVAGPPVLVGDTGKVVPLRDPEQVRRDLTAALLELANDSPARIELGLAARRRVEEVWTWDRIGAQVAAILCTAAQAGARGSGAT